MPRQPVRDPRKRFASLYRFIETDLTADNWRTLLHQAARVMPPPRRTDKPLRKRATVYRWRGSAKWPGLADDVPDLAAAREIQERFRSELAAIKRGDTSVAHVSLSRLTDRRFDRLKRKLTVPPIFVDEVEHGGVRALSSNGLAYQEPVKRVCPSCEKTYMAGPSEKRTSCGDINCRTDVENERRRQRRRDVPMRNTPQ